VSLAVVGTFYRRPWAVQTIVDALAQQSLLPDEIWFVGDSPEDIAYGDGHGLPIENVVLERSPALIPYSQSINFVLDRTDADYIAYLTDDSVPRPAKYERMVERLDAGAKAVYVSQAHCKVADPATWLLAARQQPGFIRRAERPEPAPFCTVDHTQVAHVRTDLRWPLDRQDIKLGDGVFFRALVAEVGPLEPIDEVLDWTGQLPTGVSHG
jgi:hypothetical protein